MNPLVSIVIPCYNQGQYISDAIDSVFKQTYNNYEIIIVNDGSTDENTTEILKNINHPSIQIFHTLNKGLPSARNFAIKHSKGEFILPLDADDKLHSSFLEQTISILKNNDSIAFVGTYFQHFGDSCYQGKYGLSGYSDLYVKSDPNTLCTCLFRRSEWELINGYDETMILGLEDWEFWIRLLKHTKKSVYVIPEILFYYRIKEQSMARDVNANKDKRVQLLIDRHYDLYKNNFVEAILDREKKLIEVWGYVENDNKRIKSFQQISEDMASKLLMFYFDSLTIKSPILLYGMSELSEKLLYLMDQKGLVVTTIIDQKAERIPCLFHGIKVLSLGEAIKNTPEGIIIIASIMNHQLLQDLIVEELKTCPSIITTVSIGGINNC